MRSFLALCVALSLTLVSCKKDEEAADVAAPSVAEVADSVDVGDDVTSVDAPAAVSPEADVSPSAP